MAVAPRQNDRDHYMPSGYAYYSSAATAYAQPAYQPAEPQRRPQPEPGYRVRPEKESTLSVLQKTALVASIFLMAAALLAVLSRYERIAGEYSVVNGLKSDIEQQQLQLAQLTVELEFAVSLSEAKAAAQATGMNYPTASQIVRPGELSQSAFAGGGDVNEPSE